MKNAQDFWHSLANSAIFPLPARPSTDIAWTATPFGKPTTAIDFVFSSGPGPMVSRDFAIAQGTGFAKAAGSTGAGKERRVWIDNVTPGTVSITINKAGVAPGPVTVAICGP